MGLGNTTLHQYAKSSEAFFANWYKICYKTSIEFISDLRLCGSCCTLQRFTAIPSRRLHGFGGATIAIRDFMYVVKLALDAPDILP